MTWPTKKLGEAIGFLKGKKMSVSEEQGLGYEPYIGIDTLRTHQYSLFTPEKDGVKCSKDDVLVVWDGAYAGTVGIEVSGFAGSTVAKVVIREPELGSHFLRYFWEFNGTKIRSAAQGAAIPHLSKTFINNLKVPLPPLKIQQKIVERLDAIKKAQELNDKQIELTEELFQSLLHRELDPKGKNWDFVKLGNVVQKIEYGLSVSVQNRLDENGVPILTMAEIENDGQINYQKTRKISASANELKKFKINKGELLFNWRNEKALIGKTGLFESEKDFIFASFLLRIVTNEKILPEFLWYWLNYLRTKNAYLQYAHLAGNQASYNANSLQNKISCPLILIKNQQKIVEKLSAVQEYKKKLVEQREKLKELFESVLHKSMAGKI